MPDTPLWQLGACALADAIARRELSVAEAVTANVNRMRAVNPRLNAVVDDLGDAALEEARSHDNAPAGVSRGPLWGVPVTIKENIDQTGRASPNGVAAFRANIAPGDSPVVTNLRNAGAIVIGRTNTPEFSFRLTTDNPLHGRTLNPWDERISPGGSSGGAATAVMSGMGTLAHGNDIGGSLRYPAAATGAVTVKPGLGRVPAYNPSQTAERGIIAQLTAVQGLLARETRDLRRGMQSLIAYDPHDPWMVPHPFHGPAPEVPVRVAFTTDTHEFDLHPAVAAALHRARDCLTDAGYTVVETALPELRQCARDGVRTLLGEARVFMGPDIRQHGSPTFQRIFSEYEEIFEPFAGEELLLGIARRNHYCREWNLFFQRYPLVLTPFLPTPTYVWDRDTQGHAGIEEVLGAGIYCIAMNYMGLPAGNVAAGSHEGLPVGVQLVAPRFREDLILDACEAIEQRVGCMAQKLFAREGNH